MAKVRLKCQKRVEDLYSNPIVFFLWVYEFDYINKKYGNGRYRGVMAQEVPSASFVGPEGTLMVDYSKLDVQFEELNSIDNVLLK